MIHNKSCHPREHKWSGIEYMINCLIKYPIIDKKAEMEVIKHLLTANSYSHNILDDRLQKQKREKIKESLEKPKNKWVTFTYAGKETRYVTKLFKNYNVDIAWHTNNSLEQHLSI
jgi:regulator of PEP synthase PpsR (kinase-PPPase family)